MVIVPHKKTPDGKGYVEHTLQITDRCVGAEFGPAAAALYAVFDGQETFNAAPAGEATSRVLMSVQRVIIGLNELSVVIHVPDLSDEGVAEHCRRVTEHLAANVTRRLDEVSNPRCDVCGASPKEGDGPWRFRSEPDGARFSQSRAARCPRCLGITRESPWLGDHS